MFNSCSSGADDSGGDLEYVDLDQLCAGVHKGGVDCGYFSYIWFTNTR